MRREVPVNDGARIVVSRDGETVTIEYEIRVGGAWYLTDAFDIDAHVAPDVARSLSEVAGESGGGS